MLVTLLFLTETAEDLREVLPNFPVASYRIRLGSIKETGPEDLIPIHPELVVVDATSDLDSAHDAIRRLALAWEAGLPPILVVLDAGDVAHFRLEMGADDFVLTSAPMDEIVVRLDIIARRSGRSEDATVLKVGDLTVNPENYQVYVGGRPLDLTYKEFELLKFLAQRPGRVCARDLLLREVWGYDYYGGTRTVDVHIRRLRAKLGPEHEALIETIRNVGYRLVPRPRDR
jgi:DNA-binding response OmpR family regulator